MPALATDEGTAVDDTALLNWVLVDAERGEVAMVVDLPWHMRVIPGDCSLCRSP